MAAVRPAAWRETLWRRSPRAGLAASTRTYDAYWRIDDPLPAFAFGADKALGAARRLIKMVIAEKGETAGWKEAHRL